MNQAADFFVETIDFLAPVGGHLFPCRDFELNNPDSKRPLFKGWQEPLPNIPGSLSGRPRAAGWAIPSGVVVFDFDAPSANRPMKRGIESLKQIVDDFGLNLAELPAAISGSGGVHLYFQADTTGILHGRLPADRYPDVDVKHEGGYIIVPPSPHWEKGEYEWNIAAIRMLESGQTLQLPPLPSALLSLITRTSVISDAGAFSSVRLPLDMVKSLLSVINTEEYRGKGGNEFFSLMASVKSAAGGNPDALQVFLQWCALDPKYANPRDQESVRNRWVSLKSIKEITPRSLIYTAAKAIDQRFSGPGQAEEWKRYNSLIQIARSIYTFDDLVPDEPETIVEQALGGETSSKGRVVVEWAGDASEFIDTIDETVMPVLCERHPVFMFDGRLMTMTRHQGSEWEPRPASRGTMMRLLAETCELRENKQLDRGTQVDTELPWSNALVDLIREQVVWQNVPIVDEVSKQAIVDSHLKVHTGMGQIVEGTLLWCPPTALPPMIERPTRVEAQKAFIRLMELVGYERFLNEEAKSVWVAGVITVLCRRAVKGNVPSFLVTSDFGGAGKTAMALFAQIVARDDGTVLNVDFTCTEETEKRIGAALRLNCDSLVLDDIDYNRKGEAGLESRLLNSIITTSKPRLRILGSSSLHTCPRAPVIWLTGLGIRVKPGSTLDRRLLPLILVTPEEQSVCGNFFDRVRAKSTEVIVDVVTILRAWVTSPEYPAWENRRLWASFESWDRLVRQGLQWLGMPDPLAVLESEDGKAVLGRSLSTVWAGGRGDISAAIDLVLRAGEMVGTESGVSAENIIALVRTTMEGAATQETATLLQDFTSVTRDAVNPFNARTLQATLRQFIGAAFQGRVLRRVSMNPDMFRAETQERV